MKSGMFRFSVVFGIVLLGLTVISTPSCKKDKTCIGEITVYDSTGLPLYGAKVQLADTARITSPDAGGKLMYDGRTDIYGYVKFEIKLPAVYPVRVQHPKFTDKYKFGILILNEPGSKDSETIQF
jgi:hypothetical protein